MTTDKKEIPLHEIVLEAMYNANKQKPAELKADDVLWLIEDPNINERQIREVLDWLVNKRRVTCYIGTYSLDRFEFLSQKKNEKDPVPKSKATPKKPSVKTPIKTKRTVKKTVESVDKTKNNPIKKPNIPEPPVKPTKNWSNIFLFSLATVVFGYTFFLFGTTLNTKKSTASKVINYNPLGQKGIKTKKLYSPTNDNIEPRKKFSAISNSFKNQNSNNEIIITKLIQLEQKIDKLQVINNKNNSLLIKQLSKKTTLNYLNKTINRITLASLVLFFILIVFFYKKNI